jgi:CubicO group peptidase (beta-lactamase class C family)
MRQTYKQVFESYLEQFTKTYQAQGLIVGIFNKEDLLYEHVIGYRDVERQLPIDKDTIFGIASITKSFTVVSLLQLVEQGIIDIEKPVSTYFEEWSLEESHTPTVMQLLSHAGGFYPQERFLMTDVAEDLGLDASLELAYSKTLSKEGANRIVNRINQMEFFNGLPGQHFSYSNFSFGLITDIIERYSPHGSYAQALSEGVLKPMELSRSYLAFNKTLEASNITRLYTPKDSGVEVTDDYRDMGFVLLGGGALKSTFNDLMAYTRFYLNDGRVKGQALLSAKWIDEMTKSRISYKPMQGYGYGLVVGDLGDFKYAGHSGGLTGVSSFFGFSKESNLGVVVLCNTGGVPVTSVGIAALRLAHDKYPDYKLGHYEDGSWSEEIIEKTIGGYESEEGDKVELVISEDGLEAIVAGKKMKCRIIDDHLILIQNKMEEGYSLILRDDDAYAQAIYLGSRIIPRKML